MIRPLPGFSALALLAVAPAAMAVLVNPGFAPEAAISNQFITLH